MYFIGTSWIEFAIIKTEKELIFDSNNHICDGICQLDP